MANRQQRIFQVVEQAKTQNQIEHPLSQDRLVFHVALVEFDVRVTGPGLQHVMLATLYSGHFISDLLQKRGKTSHAAAHVRGRFHS